MKPQSLVYLIIASAAAEVTSSNQLLPRKSSRNWAGAIQRASQIKYVSAILTVPSVNPSSGLGASFWVGIDGSKCKNAILQTGVDFDQGSLHPWYEWFPDDTKQYEQPISANPGDRIRMTVEAYSPTAGRSSMENLSTGEKAFVELKNQVALCLEDAEWIVENITQGLADFGSVRFEEVEWRGGKGRGNARGAVIYDLGKETRCRAEARTVECSHIGR
ncbi:hypothetical protein QQS21_004284 [Conoideocrella luteorostrata]|uniref:Concanavalin A-like lectin/glucanase n=1 Tax=Conoideocrella luteorostrata TaxID=1105319 RepID=A0AAJ0CUM6_9HYPO|nr:hypothetical protein QQS21_004284 [Conoideocrella luteorostrata]